MIILGVILLVVDIISKYFISRYLVLGSSIIIVKNFINITYVRNTGAAWSILSNNTLLVSIISGIIICLICLYIYRNKPKYKLEKVAYSFIVAGALGNFIDRIVHGYVVDFIDVMIFKYDYPIFNLADVFIVLGVIMLVIHTWRCSDGGGKGKRK